MNGAGDVVVAVLLAAGVLLELVCCVGVLVMRGALARLHYTAPASFGALLIAVAIVVREGFSLIGNKALLIAGFLLLASPVLAHVTARAAHNGGRDQPEVWPPEGAEDG